MIEILEREVEELIYVLDNSTENMSLPFRLMMSLYDGCELGCNYCLAGVHDFKGFDGPIRSVGVKKNAANILDKELSRRKGRKELIKFYHDPYHPIEEKYKITRDVLEVLSKHGWPCSIETKSDVILRDIDLIESINDQSFCNVGTSISSLNPKTVNLLEPKCSSIEKRYEMIRTFSDLRIDTFIYIAPFFPIITENDFDEIVKRSVDAGASYNVINFFHLSPSLWDYIRNPLEVIYPGITAKYEDLYIRNGRKGDMFYTLDEESQKLIKTDILNGYIGHDIDFIISGYPDDSRYVETSDSRWTYPTVHVLEQQIMARAGKYTAFEDLIEFISGFGAVDDDFMKYVHDCWEIGSLFHGNVSSVTKQGKTFYRTV